MTWQEMYPILLQGAAETLYMTFYASVLAYLIGLPLGVLLVVTRRNGILSAPAFNAMLGSIINFLRSIPFVILLAMLIPVTRVVMGKGTGTPDAVVFPLIISAFPYVARMVAGSLDEVDHGVIEAAQSMGSTTWQIIWKVLLPEALPSLVNGASICITVILGYTAMASAVGGGGLGQIAIIKGISQRKYDIMYAASIGLVLMVQLITVSGTRLTARIDHRKK